MSDRRNPFLILGVDFGASPEEAAAAFARTTRRIKNDPEAPYTIEDGTWALHQIEQQTADHTSDVTIYRVPADPNIFVPPVAGGLLGGEPQALPRQSPASDHAITRLRDQALVDLLGSSLTRICDKLRGSAYATPSQTEPSTRTRLGSDRGTAAHAGQASTQADTAEPSRSPRLPADWYPDPTRYHTEQVMLRYWDGETWTDRVIETFGTDDDPPGWYPDPDQDDPDQLRYWDGDQWTEHVRPWR